MVEETLNLKDIPFTPSKTLEKYQRAIAKEMEKRTGSELKAIRKQLKKLAEMTGMQIVEAEEEEGREETKLEEAAEEKAKEPLAIYNALYRHPDHEELTWRAGQGERPSWLTKAVEEGRTMEEMRVKEEIAQAPPISP
jgi:DNA-binding protein H-NS